MNVSPQVAAAAASTRRPEDVRPAKAAHTPGLWKINGRSPIGGLLISTHDGAADICVVTGPDGSGKAQDRARLIAAAPDLLAALHLARNWFGDRGALSRNPVIDAISAAIAKATQP